MDKTRRVRGTRKEKENNLPMFRYIRVVAAAVVVVKNLFRTSSYMYKYLLAAEDSLFNFAFSMSSPVHISNNIHSPSQLELKSS